MYCSLFIYSFPKRAAVKVLQSASFSRWLLFRLYVVLKSSIKQGQILKILQQFLLVCVLLHYYSLTWLCSPLTERVYNWKYLENDNVFHKKKNNNWFHSKRAICFPACHSTQSSYLPYPPPIFRVFQKIRIIYIVNQL